MFIRFKGVILSDVELPPTAPHPSVNEGAKAVVPPTPPKAPGVFTNILEAGFFNPNSLIIALSSE